MVINFSLKRNLGVGFDSQKSNIIVIPNNNTLSQSALESLIIDQCTQKATLIGRKK
jgi:hypothetical protein